MPGSRITLRAGSMSDKDIFDESCTVIDGAQESRVEIVRSKIAIR